MYEVRIAFFENGILKKWKARLNNPIATNQFVKLFTVGKQKESRENDIQNLLSNTEEAKARTDEEDSTNMYESHFSEMVLQFLPELPEGVDVFDPSKR